MTKKTPQAKAVAEAIAPARKSGLPKRLAKNKPGSAARLGAAKSRRAAKGWPQDYKEARQAKRLAARETKKKVKDNRPVRPPSPTLSLYFDRMRGKSGDLKKGGGALIVGWRGQGKRARKYTFPAQGVDTLAINYTDDCALLRAPVHVFIGVVVHSLWGHA